MSDWLPRSATETAAGASHPSDVQSSVADLQGGDRLGQDGVVERPARRDKDSSDQRLACELVVAPVERELLVPGPRESGIYVGEAFRQLLAHPRARRTTAATVDGVLRAAWLVEREEVYHLPVCYAGLQQQHAVRALGHPGDCEGRVVEVVQRAVAIDDIHADGVRRGMVQVNLADVELGVARTEYCEILVLGLARDDAATLPKEKAGVVADPCADLQHCQTGEVQPKRCEMRQPPPIVAGVVNRFENLDGRRH